MKIISGGQTGSDMGGLLGAQAAGIKTGGMAPKGWRTELGVNKDLGLKYGLIQSESTNYNDRTIFNVRHSDVTVIFADKIESSGTQLTIRTCKEQHKPYICNPTVNELRKFIIHYNATIVNVAGNRESVSPGIQKKTRDIIYSTFKEA